MVITTYQEFEKNINKLSSNLILISGDEKFLIDKSINAFYKTVKMLPELNLIVFDGGNLGIDQLVDACETLPVMSDNKLVIIKGLNSIRKVDKKEDDEATTETKSGDIEDYLISLSGNMPLGLTIVISVDGDENQRSKLVKTIKNVGHMVKYKELKGEDLSKVVINSFKKRDKTISKADVFFLISEVGNSLIELEKEIDKIEAFTLGRNEVKKEDIEAVVSLNVEGNIFKMVDSISKKDAKTAINILNNLLAKKENGLKILGMITRQYRMLLLTRLCLDKGMPLSQIKSRLEIKMDFILNNYINLSRNYNKNQLKKALETCLQGDINMKFGGLGDSIALELLVVELCR